MTQTTHTQFTIERSLAFSIDAVFNAWSTPEAKAQWFIGPKGKWAQLQRTLDFRVGGGELLTGLFEDGHVSEFKGQYFDIVPNERIVYAYGMWIDSKPISVSLATILFKQTDTGTLLTFTEQATFLDFNDEGSRERGTAGLLDQLEAALPNISPNIS